MTDKKI